MRTEEMVILTKEEYKELIGLLDRAIDTIGRSINQTDTVIEMLKEVMEENKLLTYILDEVLDEMEDE